VGLDGDYVRYPIPTGHRRRIDMIAPRRLWRQTLQFRRSVIQKRETFMALNGLRFLAALAVACFHFAPRISTYPESPAILRNLISEGPTAVPFFFILSGFVLAYRHLWNRERPETARAFYWARFLRLYPAYIFAFVLFLPMAVEKYLRGALSASGGGHTFIESALLSCLMLQAWTPLAQAWNGPSWSLSVEVFMYLMFPLIGLRLMNLSFKKTAGILFAGWLIPVGLACAYVSHLIPENLWVGYVRNNPLLWMPMFVAGICATKALPTWANVGGLTANVVSTGSFIAVIVLATSWPSRWSEIFVTGGIGPLLGVIVLSFTRDSALIARIVGEPVMDKLGQASYVIYIVQSPMWHYWQAFTNYLRHLPAETAGIAAWQFYAFVPFLTLSSLAIQKFVETPVRIWIQEKSKGLFTPRSAHDLAFNSARRAPSP
jgi:peptidoglycan/LPS O-acetylase OafA/YrhL